MNYDRPVVFWEAVWWVMLVSVTCVWGVLTVLGLRMRRCFIKLSLVPGDLPAGRGAPSKGESHSMMGPKGGTPGTWGTGASSAEVATKAGGAEPPGCEWPRVSVIVPSRNEARGVERAARSLLAQEYPGLEVVAVNDRSEDRTGTILDRLAVEDARFHVVHVNELPSGWLGKNHANHLGAERALGAWLLFTDGDVFLAPDALRRAIAFAVAHDLGHLVVIPRLLAPGFLERAFQTCFGLLLSFTFKFWNLRKPGTAAFVGVGAFNLVRRDAYAAMGGHRKIALEVADDIKLGLILRRSGVRQGILDSNGLVSVRWQEGLVASWRGLLKNSFAGMEWRWAFVVRGVIGLAFFCVLPVLGIFLAPTTPLRWFAVVPWVAGILLHGEAARLTSNSTGLEGFLFPLCATAIMGVILWSALLATVQGGIFWRGSYYPLSVLRPGCVRERDWPKQRAVGW